jgi:hypothetical protein
MEMTMTNEQVQRLADGEPPWEIDPKWDCALVIAYMSKNLLHIREKYESIKLDLEATRALINDVY